MRATIVFHTLDRHRGWSVTKTFNDKLHMDNFISHIERTKHGFKYDEHYIQKETANTQAQ
jgi:hypothetical protein